MGFHGGQVGNSVKIQCPVWDVWTRIKSQDKYLCRDPCKNILIQAPTKLTAQSDRIHLNNTGQYLIVTINNLKKEDSGTYVCGLKRSGWFDDAFTKFTLRVTDVGNIPNSTATSQKPTSTVIPDVFTTQQNQPTGLSNWSTSHMDATAITSTDILPYLIVGIIVMVVMVCLLIFIKCRNSKPSRTLRSNQSVVEDSQEVNIEYANISEDVQWRRRDPPTILCSVVGPADVPEELYMNSGFASLATTQASAAVSTQVGAGQDPSVCSGRPYSCTPGAVSDGGVCSTAKLLAVTQ